MKRTFIINRFDVQRGISGWSCMVHYSIGIDLDGVMPEQHVSGPVYGRFVMFIVWRAKLLARREARMIQRKSTDAST